MKITHFKRDDGGCNYYRQKLPINRLASETVKIEEIQPGMDAHSISQRLDADVIVIPRAQTIQDMLIIEQIKALGKKVVLDYDDNFFAINPFSDHYGDYGTEEVQIEMDGEKIDLWRDGKNINIKKNKATLDMVKQCVNLADLVTVTQPHLADIYSEFNPVVSCLPNCIDLKIWQKLPLKRRDDIRLYWSGGSSHYEDWIILQDVLPSIFNRYPQVKLVIMGTVFKGTIKHLDQSRIEFHPWVDTPAYPYKTAILDADISLIPLADTEFNRCKSNIKWVEQGALAIPSVCSAVSPYAESNNGVNGVFVQNTSSDWIDGISCMIEDSILRAKLGQGAIETVSRDFCIDKKNHLWLDAYKGIL